MRFIKTVTEISVPDFFPGRRKCRRLGPTEQYLKSTANNPQLSVYAGITVKISNVQKHNNKRMHISLYLNIGLQQTMGRRLN